MSGYPDGNPKTAMGALKVPLHLVPPSATHYLALAFKDGAAKYGPYNWRDAGVSASVYVAAAKRHIDAWWDGEDLSQDAEVEHLAHAMACMAIVLDAASVGMLNDDRPTKGAAGALQRSYGVTPVQIVDRKWTAEELAILDGAPATGGDTSLAALIERGESDDPQVGSLKAGEAGQC